MIVRAHNMAIKQRTEEGRMRECDPPQWPGSVAGGQARRPRAYPRRAADPHAAHVDLAHSYQP